MIILFFHFVCLVVGAEKVIWWSEKKRRFSPSTLRVHVLSLGNKGLYTQSRLAGPIITALLRVQTICVPEVE